jgi:RND family efflux transporter MFP subunit
MKNPKIIIVAILVFSFGCQKAATKEQTAKPVKVKEVEIYSAKKGSRYSATIRPNTQVEVGFKVGGYVETIISVNDASGVRHTLQAGDTVTRGQVLAQLRRSDYQTKLAQAVSQKGEVQKSVNTTRAQVREAETSISINQSQLTEAETNLAQAKVDFTRAKNLYDVQSLTKKDFEAAQTALDMAQTKVDSARASLKTAQAKIKTAETQIELTEAQVGTAETVIDQLKIPLQDTTLRAPFTAIVLERKIEAGELVAPNAPAFVLADTASVKAVFGVPDVELQKLRSGQILALTSDALPNQELAGRVSRIAPSADQNSRVFEIEVTIPNPQNLLKPGMIASLEILAEQTGEEQRVVPLGAITRSKTDADSYSVFVVQEIDGVQIVRVRQVQLGETFGNTVAVTKGVGTGEKVVTSGAAFLTDGEKVQVIP